MRFETDLSLKLPRKARAGSSRSSAASARWTTRCPFMPIQPLAFTNPIYIGK